MKRSFINDLSKRADTADEAAALTDAAIAPHRPKQ
jgi:hypothetical protein